MFGTYLYISGISNQFWGKIIYLSFESSIKKVFYRTDISGCKILINELYLEINF